MRAALRYGPGLLLMTVVLAGCGGTHDTPLGSIDIGKPAPEIAGEDTDGKAMKLSDYRGKVIMLDFWGNW